MDIKEYIQRVNQGPENTDVKKPIQENLIQKMERNADEMERKIVRFTNIDTESFTHSYRGISITVASGASQIMRLPEADHLATHLARKIISRGRKTSKEFMSNPRVLWNDEEIMTLKIEILSDVGFEKLEEATPEEKHRKDLENLQKDFGGKPKEEMKKKNDVSDPSKITKKQVIEELEKGGVTVDASKTKEQLLQDLMDLEAKG